MGRDTTASKRMAAMRSREKAAGLRRLNVAVLPEVFDKIAELMKQHNCVSQARLIELLVLAPSAVATVRKGKDIRVESAPPVTATATVVTQTKEVKAAPAAVPVTESTPKKTAPKKLKELLKKAAPVKAKAPAKKVTPPPPPKAETAQLSLF